MKNTQELCEIYNDSEDIESFYVGYIVAVDEQSVIFESISKLGRQDGFYCIPIESIFALNYKTKYLNNMRKLVESNAFVRRSIDFKEKLFESILEYIKSERQLCCIEGMNGTRLIGFISSLEDECVILNQVDADGEKDGICIIKQEDVFEVSFDTEYWLKLKVLLV